MCLEGLPLLSTKHKVAFEQRTKRLQRCCLDSSHQSLSVMHGCMFGGNQTARQQKHLKPIPCTQMMIWTCFAAPGHHAVAESIMNSSAKHLRGKYKDMALWATAWLKLHHVKGCKSQAHKSTRECLKKRKATRCNGPVSPVEMWWWVVSRAVEKQIVTTSILMERV